ncbi:MAG: DHA2 family efflux MFS transporter permease subunit [Alphaproteobacteria bacterium]
MASVMAATTVFIMNQTNVIVALPHMQGSFSATTDQIAWVITAFILTLTIMTALTGWLSAHIGRKRLYVISVAGFTACSFLCAIATSLEAEVLFRAIQGAVGAPIIPLSQAIVMDTYPKEKHGAALSLWGLSLTVGPVLGPIIGGYVTEMYSWPWVFLFNLPVGIVVVIAVLAVVPHSGHQQTRQLDWLGFAAIAVTLCAFQIVLNRGQHLDWFDSAEIVIAALVTLFGAYVFIVHSATTKAPFIDRALLKDRNVVLGFVLITLWGMVLHSPLVLLSLRLQGLENYPVMTTGFLMAPRGIGGCLAMLVVGRLTKLLPLKLCVSIGFCSVIAGAWIVAHWPLHAADAEVAISAIFLGFGTSFAWVPLSMLAFGTIDQQHRTEGVAFFNLFLNMGSSLGITFAILILTNGVQVNHEQLITFVTPFNKLFHDALTPHLWGLDSHKGLLSLDKEIGRQSLSIAFNNAFLAIGVIAAAAIPLVFCFKEKKAPEAPKSAPAPKPMAAPAAARRGAD